MSFSNSVPQKNLRRGSGFVGRPDHGSTVDSKERTDSSDGTANIFSRRQSRMFSMDLSDFGADEDHDKIVNKYKQIGFSLAADLALLAYGSCWTMSSIVLPQLEQQSETEMTITSEEGSWFASIFVIGSISGALAGGITAEKLGRKKALLIDNIILVLGLLCIALPHNFAIMLVGRYLCGHACSSIQVVAPTYTSEISQPLIRPLTSNIFTVTFTCGGTIMFVIGALLPWQIAVKLTLIWPILSFICIMWFCPESPIWLLNKGKDELAEESLRTLRGDETIVRNELKRLKAALIAMEIAMKTEGDSASGMREFFSLFKDKAILKPIGILLFLITMSVNWGGFPSLSFYMIILLQKSNFHYDPYIMAAGLSVFRSILMILASGFTSKMRRRPLFFICGLFHLVGMATISLYNFFNKDGGLEEKISFAQWIPIIAIMLIYSFSSIGYVFMVYILTPELLPSYARAIGCGLVGMFDNIGLALSVKMIPTLLDSIDVSGTFGLYAINTVAVLIFSYFFVPETYGLSLEDIERLFRGSKKPDVNQLELQQLERRKSSFNKLRSNSVLSLYGKNSQHTR